MPGLLENDIETVSCSRGVFPTIYANQMSVDRDENGSVDTADRKLERLRNGEVKDIGIQTDDLWEFKPKMPSM